MNIQVKDLLDKELMDKLDTEFPKIPEKRIRTKQVTRTLNPKISNKIAKSLKKLRKKSSEVPQKYNEYMNSKYWALRKNAYWKKYDRKCSICLSPSNIVLHHLVYGSFGHEKDKNLIPFCVYHHSLFHKIYGVRGNMFKATHKFIQEQRRIK